jgi:hypothetical protein
VKPGRLATVFKTAEGPEYTPTPIAACIQVVKLDVERAAIDNAIAKMNKNIKRLKIR